MSDSRRLTRAGLAAASPQGLVTPASPLSHGRHDGDLE